MTGVRCFHYFILQLLFSCCHFSVLFSFINTFPHIELVWAPSTCCCTIGAIDQCKQQHLPVWSLFRRLHIHIIDIKGSHKQFMLAPKQLHGAFYLYFKPLSVPCGIEDWIWPLHWSHPASCGNQLSETTAMWELSNYHCDGKEVSFLSQVWMC